jgi:hypothetical protein
MRALVLTLALLAASAPPQNTAPNSAAKNAPNSARTAPQNGFLFWSLSRKTVEFLLQPVPQPNAARFAQLKQTFTDLQCPETALREQPTPDGKNLLCILPGTASENPAPMKPGNTAANTQFGTILFIAHYEHEGTGQSAVDDWSGAIMLPFLYYALSATPRHHAFVFAAVDGEAGATSLFDSFSPSERQVIKGVVDLDALGLGPAQFYLSSNDSSFSNSGGWWFLRNQLLQAAADQRFDTPVAAIPGGWYKIDDTREFRHHSIPSILIHSVSFNARGLPGSERDTASAINHDIYFNTFVLLAYYAAELDKPWPSPGPNATSRPSNGRRH